MGVGGAEVGPGISTPAGAGSGTLTDITSTGGTVTVSNGTGPVVNLEVPYPALTDAAGSLALDYDITTALATYLTTASLAAGTWLIMHGAYVNYLDATAALEFQANEGTATATFDGQNATEIASATATLLVPMSLAFRATITVAGTIVFQAKASTITGTPVIRAATSASSFPNVTGYTAVRIK
jgi:hypothetical protein